MDNIINNINKIIQTQSRRVLIAVLAAPLSIFLHEIGHALTAIRVGYTNVYLTYHSWGGRQPIGITSIERAWINAGGPIASFLLVVACIIFIGLRRKTVFPRVLGMLAPIQFMGSLLYILSSLLGINGSKVYDAARAANNLGISVFTASIPGSIVLVAAWVFFIRSIEEDARVKEVLSIIVGGIFGFLLWLLVIGPIILPD